MRLERPVDPLGETAGAGGTARDQNSLRGIGQGGLTRKLEPEASIKPVQNLDEVTQMGTKEEVQHGEVKD